MKHEVATIDPKFCIDSDDYLYWEVPARVDTEMVRKMFLQFKVWHSIAYNKTNNGRRLSEKGILAEFWRLWGLGGPLVAYLKPGGATGIWGRIRTEILLSTPVIVHLECQAEHGRSLEQSGY